MTAKPEIERRYASIRSSMEKEGLEALVVAGTEYTGFDGAIAYVSGFKILHRYCYVLLPLEGEPTLVIPSESRWNGDKGTSWLDDILFVDTPGEWLRNRCQDRGWRRIGVYGFDYVMAVRDYRALQSGSFELVSFDEQFDLACAVKSEEELDSFRESMNIIEDGFWALVKAYEPGKTEAEIFAPAAARYIARGTERHQMNILLAGEDGELRPDFRLPLLRAVDPKDLLLYSMEIAGPRFHWVEFSRPLGTAPSARTASLMEAYEESGAIALEVLRDGVVAQDAHRALGKPFVERGFKLGHLTGHSIGMVMIEHPRLGEGIETLLRENMVLSIHPHAVSEDGRCCLYMQQNYRVGKDAGEMLSEVPLRIFDGSEPRP
jgi:Xaa-Pro aminopeptidase